MYESEKWRKHPRGAAYTFFIGIGHLKNAQTQFVTLLYGISCLSFFQICVIIHLEFFSLFLFIERVRQRCDGIGKTVQYYYYFLFQQHGVFRE